MSHNPPVTPLLQTLRERLRQVFKLQQAGAAHARLTQAVGFADGYMQALIDAGLAEERELLGLVADERRNEHGPGSAFVEPEAADVRAVA